MVMASYCKTSAAHHTGADSYHVKLEATVQGDSLHPSALCEASPDYSRGVLKEGAPQFHSTIDFGKIDEFKQLLDSLSADDVDILHLAAKGYSHDQIGWLLNASIHSVKRCISKAEEIIAADMLPQAGLITAMRQSTLENRYARHLAKSLMGLVDARIMRVIVDESHCGLQLMLATGDQMKLWLCADDELDRPGWAFLENIEGEFVYEDEMRCLAEQVALFVGRGRNSTETARQILHDIAEKAVELLDQIDGDCDLENNGDDWETESFEDQDEVPLGLNPRYQTERDIRTEPSLSKQTPNDRVQQQRPLATQNPDTQCEIRVLETKPLELQIPTSPAPLPQNSYLVADQRSDVRSLNVEIGSQVNNAPNAASIEADIEEKLARLQHMAAAIDEMPKRMKGPFKKRLDIELANLVSCLEARGIAVNVDLNPRVYPIHLDAEFHL
jgi:hypothetical protein